MHRILIALTAAGLTFSSPCFSGETEIKAVQDVIDGQLKAFVSNDGALAYSFAAPNIKRMFPTADIFMDMVSKGYAPVRRPKGYAFGKVQEISPTSIIQQVLVTGPDGKDYEAVYTLELQPDGTYRITGCSLRASNSLST
ncbi:hypothetical protein ASD64_15500 [Mesorhizobium sp. Root157]|uniref:DUF4864 domain-containing protein n=1 Tax=Mesorhizobium sp. Root157 TaxID=1736477 RepID=UPI0006F3BAD9|nr:DUF4864 domain-containing protein [Mesorhizobium sp. Root157]KQZ99710.1 hypothetical protein ASD64_15500 [Mesorhizobium sp. Root157]